MKVLTLIIQQQYFDEILAGTKTEEFREVKPTTAGKYIIYVDSDGKKYKPSALPDDVDVDIEIIKYDAIQLYVGYHTKRDSALIEIKDTEIEIYEDEVYTHKGKEYNAAMMIYHLGRVIEVHRK